MNSKIDLSVRLYREQLLKDPWRPCYHFCVPDGNGTPGDPNGCFYYDGLHHLMYLYAHPEKGFCWGHVVSHDLLHWRHLPDALEKSAHDDGCFSGGAFVDDDGTAYLSFWVYNDENKAVAPDAYTGVMLAHSKPPYHKWERVIPIAIASDSWGVAHVNGQPIGCADPSNIWKKDGRYYMQTGNLLVLNNYGRQADSPKELRGDWTELFSSDDLLQWKWEGRFYDRHECEDHPDDSEDDMCPSFLPLPSSKAGGKPSDEYLQLFIAHNRGCQYYIGRLDNNQFHPRLHGRMSWVDDAYFAPEAYIDDKGRQIAFAWLRDNLPDDYQRFGWSGVMGLPRVLWCHEDGTLGIAPAQEVDQLARVEAVWQKAELRMLDDIPVKTPYSCRVQWTAETNAASTGIRINNENQCVEIYYDPNHRELVLDAVNSGSESRAVRECAPLTLPAGETANVTVYVDHSVLEVFANDRQAITRRVYMPLENAVFQLTNVENTRELSISTMMPSQPY